MDQVITFDKSLQQRLQEYEDVLSGFKVLSVSAIQKEWAFYLELTLDPNGWQAIWKIPRLTCETLDLVEMTALVRIIAVQDDIHLPMKHGVPLIQLWPTKEQDKTVALNLDSTANALDMLRFFYTYVFMPWDSEDDENDWKGKHLESRLRLYYDMKNGVLPRATAKHINFLLTEARHIKSKRELVEMKLTDAEMDELNEIGENDYLIQLTELHLRMLEIKNEVDILENPLFRKVLAKRQQPKAVDNTSRIWLVFEVGSIDNCIDFLNKVKELFPHEEIQFSSNLNECFENGGANDVFLIGKSKHQVEVIGALEKGGILKGIYGKECSLLQSMIEDIMFDFQGTEVVLENVTIDASLSQCAVVVRRGHTKFVNCKIIGDGKSSTHQGIIVLAGAAIELINCELSGFCAAIVGNSGSSISIQSTEISNVNFGLKIYDNCKVEVKKCTFHDCAEYGICIETENNMHGVGDHHKVGNFDILSIIPDMTTEFVSGTNNQKGDVLINHSSKIHGIQDLFTDDDPTISKETSEEETQTDEELNVVENTLTENRMDTISPATV